MFKTAVLGFPLKAITWLRADIYRNSPEKRLEAEAAIRKFYNDNEANLEARGVTEAEVRWVSPAFVPWSLY